MASTVYQYVLNLQDKMSATLRSVGALGSQTFDKLEEKQNRLNNSTMGLGGMLGRLGLAFGAFEIGKGIVTAGVDMEQTRISFEVMMGSAQKANAVISDLQKFAAKTPFQQDEVVNAGQQLLNASVSAEKLTERLKMIGDISAGAKVPLNEMASLYAKIMSRGSAQTDELNMISERRIPILKYLAKLNNTNEAGVLKMSEKRLLTSDKMNEAFEAMTKSGGQYFNLMDRLSTTVGGKWSNLKDIISIKAQQIGETLIPTLGKIVDFLINAITPLANMFDWLFDKISSIIKPFVDFVKFLGRGSIAADLINGSILVLIGTFGILKIAQLAHIAVLKMSAAWEAIQLLSINVLGDSFLTASVKTKIFAAAQAFLNTTFLANPVFWIIMGIVALIAVITYVIYKTESWGQVWENFVIEMKSAWTNVVDRIELYWLKFKDGFLSGLDQLKIGWYSFKGLWNKEEADKGMLDVFNAQKARGAEITALQEKININKTTSVTNGLKKGAWNSDKSITDIFGGLKESLGMGANGDLTASNLMKGVTKPAAGVGANGTGELGITSGVGTNPLTDTSKNIAGGGSRPTSITINLQNLVGEIKVISQTLTGGVNDIEKQVREAFLRVLNSANGIAYGK